MRIGEPARKHGLSDEDILHACRNAIHGRDLGEGFTMLIGPDAAGRMLEIRVL